MGSEMCIRDSNGFYESAGILWEKTKSENIYNMHKDDQKKVQKMPSTFVVDEIKKRLTGHNDQIYITGHSKGGAMATVTACFAATSYESQIEKAPQQTFTFASPRVGNNEFAKAFNEEIVQYSFENRDDAVPLLPFRPRTLVGR